MFYQKLNRSLSRYAYSKFLRPVCVSSNFQKVQALKKHESKRNFGYFATGFQTERSSHEKNKESNWNEGMYNEDSYFVKMLRLIPAFIIVSLLGLHSALCLKDSSEGNNSNEQNDNSKKFKTDVNSKMKDHNNSYHYYGDGYYYANKDEIEVYSELKETASSNILPPASSNSVPPPASSNSVPPPSPEGNTSTDKKDLKPLPNPRNYTTQDSLTLKNAIDLARIHVNRKLNEAGAPGISIAVTVNGKLVWSEGIGYSDVENGVRMSPFTVLRIASISKALTATAIGQLIDEGKLELDVPVQKYVPSFPEKTFKGEKIAITTRHLLTHTSGIRHYQLKEEIELNEGKKDIEDKAETTKVIDSESNKEESKEDNSKDNSEIGKEEIDNIKFDEKRKKMRELLADKAMRKTAKKDKTKEFDLEEYYLKEEFLNLEESLQLFQDDELLFKPGTNYQYSSHGFTLVSAVLEKASGKSFTRLITDLFENLSMQYTFLDQNDNIIYRRGRYYVRDGKGHLQNAPYVNNSYKWAGGGFLSNVYDLINFGNVMLYSYQNIEDRDPKGFLKSSTVRQLWTASPESEKYGNGSLYGLGWSVGQGEKSQKAFAYNKKFYASHSGGAIGASSALLIMPTYDPYNEKQPEEAQTDLAQGIVVAVVTNLQDVALTKMAVKVARIFDRVPVESKVVGNVSDILKNKVYSLEKS